MSAPQWNGAWHPLAERFPMLSEDELREMAASIAERGQYTPCRLAPDGLGLDGRNRVAACALANVAPRWEVYEGDPILFIVEVNAVGRSWTTTQRAMAVAIGLVDAKKRRGGRFVRDAVPRDSGRSSAQRNSPWQKAVSQAGFILDHAPELADKVLSGELALDAAYRKADENRKGRARVAALGGELAALVETGVIDVDEAERRAAEAKRLDVLDDDLAERVREGTLDLDEAEAIAAQRAERMAVWIECVRTALDVLVPMAVGPIPPGINGALNENERAALTTALEAWRTANVEL